MRLVVAISICLLYTHASQSQSLNWAKNTTGNSGDWGLAIAVDSSGNTYTTGYFLNTVDFDPGPGVVNMTSNGWYDIFLVKLDSTGSFQWAKRWGSTGSDYGQDVCIDDSGNVIITGYFRNSMDFDPGAGSQVKNSLGGLDMYLIKLDSLGNYLWGNHVGSSGSVTGAELAIDQQSNIVAVGGFTGITDFDPSPSTYNLNGGPGGAGFITKVNWKGQHQFTKMLDGSGGAGPQSVIFDRSGKLVIAGLYTDSVDADPGPGVQIHVADSLQDAFVMRLDSSGNLEWFRSVGGKDRDYAYDVSTDSKNNVYYVGVFEQSIDLDPGGGVDQRISNGQEDAFLTKLDSTGSYVWSRVIGGKFYDLFKTVECNQFDEILVGGHFVDTVDLTPNFSVDTHVSNGHWDGLLMRFAPNGAVKRVMWHGDAGSDRIEDIAIAGSSGSFHTTGIFDGNVDYDPSCNGNQVISGASNVDVFMTRYRKCSGESSNSISATACQRYLSPSGNYYWTSSGTFVDTVTTCSNCDSIITVNLTVTSVDTSVSQAGLLLTSNQTGASYQWLDCSNNYSQIPGATNQQYTVTASGWYAVQVTTNGCTDTSACLPVFLVGSNSYAATNLKAHPNPVTDRLQILANGTIGSYKVLDLSGRVVLSGHSQTRLLTLDVRPLRAGTYIFRNQFATQRFVVTER